tara:strand:- start:89 stop:667 length:579 start_codon:yes stop_codon:yes gene_type:complete
VDIKSLEKIAKGVLGPAYNPVRALIPDVRGIVPGLQEAGVTLEEAVEKKDIGSGLEGLLKTATVPVMAAAEFNPVAKKASKVLKQASPKKQRDYPDTKLADRVPFKNQIQFLEDHGFGPRIGGKKANTFEIIDNERIIVYSDTGRPTSGGKEKVSQKTFKNPTLKQMREWMGYKEGGRVERNPYKNYESKAI